MKIHQTMTQSFPPQRQESGVRGEKGEVGDGGAMKENYVKKEFQC